MLLYPISLFRESNYLDYYSFTENLIFNFIGSQKRILDIGCRNGLFTERIFSKTNAKEIIGIDIDFQVIQEANKNNKNEKVKYYCGDGENIEFILSFGKFDVIHLRNTFHHFNEPEKFLKNIIKLLEPNGVLIIVDIDRESMIFDFGKFSFGEFITWISLLGKFGLFKTISTISKVGFITKDYRLHHKEDVFRQTKIGWYKKKDIKNNFSNLFNNYLYGRIGGLLGMGGVYYFIFIKED